MKKKWLIILLIPVCLLILVSVFSPIVRLDPDHTRNGFSVPALTQKEMEQIKEDTKNLDDEQIFWYGITKAKDDLEFTRANDVKNKKANCVGYAAYAKQIMDYGLKVNGYDNKTFHYVGYLKPFGLFNLNNAVCKVMKNERDKKFFSDHDFVGIEMENGRQILFSPSLYDKFNFGCWTEINK